METLFELFKETYITFTSEQAVLAYQILYATSPIWLPMTLGLIFWRVWIKYIRSDYIASQEYVLLEIKLPPEVSKSPLAMEVVLSGLNAIGGEGEWHKRYIIGRVRHYFTFEVASFEGNLHFYAWTRRSVLKDVLESNFYGQYPNIELTEVPDYTDMLAHYDAKKYNLFGLYYKLGMPDPYPIKTYVDYGLDKDPKEEFKIDPFTSVLELMSNIGKGEYWWYQIGFRAHREKSIKGSWFKKTTWQDETKAIIEKIYDGMKEVSESDQGGKFEFKRRPTKGEEMAIERLERSIEKPAFDVGIRTIYFAKPENYIMRGPSLNNLMKVYGGVYIEDSKNRVSYSYNSFMPTKSTDYDYPWQDFTHVREMNNRHHIVDGYRRRQFFHAPHEKPTFVLSSEELATIFHPVGTVLQTPTVERVSSRKAEPPRNLPQ